MALADRDQVILDTIAAALSAEDPQLAALLAPGAPGAGLVPGAAEDPGRGRWWRRARDRRGGATDGGHGQRDDGEPDEPVPA